MVNVYEPLLMKAMVSSEADEVYARWVPDVVDDVTIAPTFEGNKYRVTDVVTEDITKYLLFGVVS